MHFVMCKKRYLQLRRWHLIAEYDGSLFEGRRFHLHFCLTLPAVAFAGIYPREFVALVVLVTRWYAKSVGKSVELR